MKKLKFLMFLILSLFLNNDVKSQLNINDYFNDFIEYTNTEIKSTNCLMQSSAFINKYGNLTYNIPKQTNPEIKTILVNFNIMQKDDGSGNFTNSTTDMANLNQIFQWMKNYYQYNAQPSDPISGVQFIPDTYIRFELTGIYFYQNTNLWNSTSSEDLLNKIRTSYPSRMNQLNIFFTEGNGGTASGYTNSLPSYINFNLNQCIVTFQKYNNGNTIGHYATAGHLAHEMGHVLELLHTYEPSCCHETCDESNPDYLDDVFGIDGINTNCWHDAGWGCDPYAIGNTCTNNMMGGVQASSYFSPKQIGKMHRVLRLASTRRYVKECTYYNYPLEIISDETWDFNIKLYSDLIVKNGSVLTITCNVIMPEQSKIIVEPGAKLILDGGTVTSACIGLWQGIEVCGNEQASQLTPGAQGIVELKNGAIIENALVAIKTVKTDANGNEIYGSFGGIIKANDAIFRNNKVAVEFLRYWNFNPANNKDLRNLSYFTNCTFETTSKLADNTVNPDAFVKLNGVHGIKFNGNTFQNTVPQSFAVNDRGIGISSIDASFTVAPLCTSTEPILPCPVSELYSV